MSHLAPASADPLASAAQAQLQQIVDHTSAAMFVKDLSGRYLFVNREFQRMKGVPVAAIVGRVDADVFPATAEDLRRNDRQVVDERRAIDFEEVVETAQGRRTYLSHKFPLFDAGGRAYAVCGVATDITERKRSEEALRAAALAVTEAEGEGVFHELVRCLSTILAVDVAMIAVYADNDSTRMRTLAACLDGKPLANFEYALAGSPCRHVVGREFRFVGAGVGPEFPPGTLFAAKGMDSYAAMPINDSGGRPLGLIATMGRRPMRDPALTEAMLKIFAMRAAAEIERAHSDAALRASEASYRAIFEASEDAILVHDWDTGAFVDANPKACRTYGYTADEIRALCVADLSSGVPPYTMADAARWIDRAKAGEIVSFEWHRRNRDGSLHWDEVDLKAAQIAGTRRILAFARDITARRAAEDALRASEEQYRAIFNASVDGVALVDKEGRIVDLNPAFARLLGFAREELIGTPGQAIFPDELRGYCEEVRVKVLAGEACHEEIKVRHKRGTRLDVEIRAAMMLYREAPHALLIMRDLTERRQVERERGELEAQLRQAQKMEAIGHLTGGIAHDFNNLLTSIMGYVTLAAERSERSGDDKLATYLDQAHVACTRARDLIQQMLTFSRGRRGEPRALALAPLVRESVKLLRSSFPATVALETDLDDDAPPVLIDPVQLEQVLMNLAINARDAMRSSGEIRVVARRAGPVAAVCASCRKPLDGEMVELSVADTGPGIAHDVQERMFEPFYTTKEVGQGSGMGLSTVHGIVHEHGGHIVVASAPGAGARFQVLLPALRSPARGSAGPQAPPRSAALPRSDLEGRVAVIDDEASVAAFIVDLLTHWGVDVTAYADPRAALGALAEGAAFDLVLTDQTMPGMTGVDVALAVRTLRPGLPVVLYTGYDEGLTAANLRAAGIASLVRKPIEPPVLLAVLQTHLSRRRAST